MVLAISQCCKSKSCCDAESRQCSVVCGAGWAVATCDNTDPNDGAWCSHRATSHRASVISSVKHGECVRAGTGTH